MAGGGSRTKARREREVHCKRIEAIHAAGEAALRDETLLNDFLVRYEDLATEIAATEKCHWDLLGLCTEEEVAAEDNYLTRFDSIVYSTKSLHRQLAPKIDALNVSMKPNLNLNSSCCGASTSRRKVEVQRLEIPKFDGDIKKWPLFFDIYNALIHTSDEYHTIEKFQILSSSLVGEARSILANYLMLEENYDTVYDLLKTRYNNGRMLLNTYWGEVYCAPVVKNDSLGEMKSLITIFNENIAALERIPGVDLWDYSKFQFLSKKLGPNLKTKFEMYHSEKKGKTIPTYNELYVFLEKNCQALENTSLLDLKYSEPSHKKTVDSNLKKRSMLSTTSSNNSKNQEANKETKSNVCVCCKQSSCQDSLIKCDKFLQWDAHERHAFVKRERLCFRCFSKVHGLTKCPEKTRCGVCNRDSHNILLCFHHDSKNTESPGDNIVPVKSNFTNGMPTFKTVLFATAQISVWCENGKLLTCRAVLDSASEASFITLSCVSRLGITTTPCVVPVQGIDNMTTSSSLGTVKFCISPSQRNSPCFNVNAVVIPSICGLTPSVKVNANSWEHLKGLTLADPDFGAPKEADILLGADIFSQVMLDGVQKGKVGEPCAINTMFGYVLLGGIKTNEDKIVSCVTSFAPLNETLKSFWELESLPQEIPLSAEEQKCEKFFLESHSRDLNGRYCVRLPFKESPDFLGESFGQALRRFKLLELRLLRNVKLHESYVEFMSDYLDQGHMSLSRLPNPKQGYFIPHHCVVKGDNDKIRVVFDASCKTKDANLSLNDVLHVGPKLQNDIASILFSFRLYSVIFLADIRQMYRQILVHPEDVVYQKILWRFDQSEPIREYCLNTVTYGVNSSPYLSIRCLLQLVEDHGADYPLACDILRHGTYVDDCAGLADSLIEALEKQRQLIALLKHGCFELRKWASNRPELLSAVPECHQQPIVFSEKDSTTLKVLGLQWNPSSDFFSYNVQPIQRECTKRNILSEIARLYDPLGFVTPVVLVAKLLMQQMWRDGISWDERPSDDVVLKWQTYINELPALQSLLIPRYIVKTDAVSTELHAFCDASTLAIGSSVYLKQIDREENAHISLLCGKSRVAPLKNVSLPRLELMAACLLSDLVCFALDNLKNVKVDKIWAWSDSTITIHWIQSSPQRWKCFVANRVALIQEKIPPECWHHVKGTLNPSDCCSRGTLASELISHPLWWAGPPWLKDCDQNSDFGCSDVELSEAVICEQRKTVLFAKLLAHPFLDLLVRFSSLRKIQRIIALCIRFFENCKLPVNTRNLDKCISQIELYKSLLIVVKLVQRFEFHEELCKLKKQELCSKPLRKLCCFLDKDGVIRVGGRLRNADVSYDYKHPILLPRSHRLTDLVIETFHQENCHPGPRALQNLLMQQFWILSVRRAIHHVLSKCVRCFRTNPTPLSPLMSDLPLARVSAVKAFTHTGVDFAGPIKMTLGKRRGIVAQKAYICLFICLPTRALHLEVVSDMTSSSCLAAIRRFIGRRGSCTDLYSDQGTNFQGVNNLLLKYCKSSADIMGIKWHFNPPSAPHFGGSWESGVKSVKTHMKRVVGDQVLTYEEWQTVLIQIESVLNSRPLCDMSPDSNDLLSLTPSHFLTLEPVTAPPDENLLQISPNRLSRWQLLQKMHQHFWKRWHSEYLHTLQQRAKWNCGGLAPKIGTLVIIRDDNAPPLSWPLGRIIHLYPSSDNVPRVAKVRLEKGEMDRPLVKLCPLPSQ